MFISHWLALLALCTAAPAYAAGFQFQFIGSALAPEGIETEARFGDVRHTCLVDTGARFSQVKAPLLADLPAHGQQVGGGVSGVAKMVDMLKLDMAVGDWHALNTEVGRTDVLPYDCLIGNNVFLHHAFSLDFQRQRIEEPSEVPGKTYPLSVYASEIGGEFGFDVEFSGHKLAALFDTGATATVVDLKFVDRHPENFTFVREVTGVDGSEQTLHLKIFSAKRLAFADQSLENVEIYSVNLDYLQSKVPGVEAILGLSEMVGHHWYFNPLTRVWGLSEVRP